MREINTSIADIEMALFRLRQAFARHKIPLPDVLEYTDSRRGYEASMSLRLAARQHTNFAMDSSARPFIELSLAGFTVRFEARKIEHPGTGVELDDGETRHVFMGPGTEE